jgi:hypothetical protein
MLPLLKAMKWALIPSSSLLFEHNPSSNPSHPARVNTEATLLLLRFPSSRRPHLLLAVKVARRALVRVVGDRVLQLENVFLGSGVDEGGIALALFRSLARYVRFVREAAGAGELFWIGGEGKSEAVVATGGAAEDEVVDVEVAV